MMLVMSSLMMTVYDYIITCDVMTYISYMMHMITCDDIRSMLNVDVW